MDRKCAAQAQRVARIRGKQDAPPAARPNPNQAPDSAWWSFMPSSNTPRPGARSGWAVAGDPWGQGLAGTSSTGWRQRQVAAGVWDGLWGEEKGARRPPRDPGVWEGSDGNSEPPLGLHSASKLGASARAQPGSQGPEGGRGQGCATGEGDEGTLIC